MHGTDCSDRLANTMHTPEASNGKGQLKILQTKRDPISGIRRQLGMGRTVSNAKMQRRADCVHRKACTKDPKKGSCFWKH